MSDLPSVEDLTSLASLLAPGFIIIGIRTRYKGGTLQDWKDGLMAYAIASTAYYAAVSPLFHVQPSTILPGWLWGVKLPSWVWGFLQFFILPCVVGILVVLFDQREWFYKISTYFKLRAAHHTPAAWDYAFSGLRDARYMIVKLHDGTKYAGKYGSASFASSNRDERDLLIDEVWNICDDGLWTVLEPRRSVLLCGRDISWVEILDKRVP